MPEVAERVKNDTTDGSPIYRVTAILSKSAAFDYGNGTSTEIRFDNLPNNFENVRYYDTRYYKGITNDFDGAVRELLKEQFGRNLKEIVEV